MSCSLLAGAAGTASCAVTYTPTVVGTGTHSITGTFVPTSNRSEEHAAVALTVASLASAPTPAIVSSVPGSGTVNSGYVCTATVTDTSASPSFFFNDTATTEIYTLSLHDALPIYLLAGAAGTASCAVTYTPTVVGTGTHSITGTFVPTSN